MLGLCVPKHVGNRLERVCAFERTSVRARASETTTEKAKRRRTHVKSDVKGTRGAYGKYQPNVNPTIRLLHPPPPPSPLVKSSNSVTVTRARTPLYCATAKPNCHILARRRKMHLNANRFFDHALYRGR
jgi:hypothetical protein